MNQQIKTSLGTAILIIIAITAGAFVWVYEKGQSVQEENQTIMPTAKFGPGGMPKKFCTQEAKLCEDGKTYVSRTGPNCEFASCVEGLNKIYSVDELVSANVSNGTIVTVTGVAGDCVDRMVSESGEASPPGGCHLRGTEKTIILDNFDANQYRGKTITVSGQVKYCTDGVKKYICALEDVKLISEDSNISNWQTYKNEKYGFEFQYPGDWKNLTVEDLSRDGQPGILLGFELPTSDQNWVKIGEKKGIVFTILAVSKNDIEKIGRECVKVESGIKCLANDKKLGQNNSYAFYNIPGPRESDEYPSDFPLQFYQKIDQILSTFKFTK